MSPPSGGVPILGNGRKHHLDGGQEHAVELTTTDGGAHVATFMFQAPTTPDGTIDLGAAQAPDWERNAITAVGQQVQMAQLQEIPTNALPGTRPPVMIGVHGKRMVVLVHVTSFRYLGRVLEKTARNLTVEGPDGATRKYWADAQAQIEDHMGLATD